ncbi:uncharacterized protein BKCO1_13000145 [Diplodia corticola]|uniref:Clr5 domain-containing protein n=1 Tax=Diplodia corticola TaxID=236234 RepID=A0A1J9S8C1_9PEZI|nr:uncharacterized protein BKCO1_13000145 [Diplodia corticola]OJD36164.1 hypothetical protein BKCO1_13000145 [Diplodia corticola]
MTKDWLQVKDKIRELYAVQGKSLTEVTRNLRNENGFNASTRAYRSKLCEWGFKRGRRPSASPPEHLQEISPTPILDSSQEVARTNTLENDVGAHHIPDEVISSLVDSIQHSHVERLESFLQGPYRFVVNNWHIGFTSFFHEEAAAPEVLGKSLLSLATSHSTPEVVKLLLREGADVNLKDLRTCETPLMAAIRRGDCSLVRLLLENGSSMAPLNSDGLHALQVAALFANKRRIIEQLAMPHSALLDAPAAEGPYRGATTFELVLKRRAKCAYSSDYSLVNEYAHILLDAGAQFEGLERLIVLPLLDRHLSRLDSIANDTRGLLIEFLKAGLNLQTLIGNLPDNGHPGLQTLLHALVFHSPMSGMAPFLAELIDVSNSGILHTICTGCIYDYSTTNDNDICNTVNTLLERGLDPDILDESGHTPLSQLIDYIMFIPHHREPFTQMEILRALLRHGASPYRVIARVCPVEQVLMPVTYWNYSKRLHAFDVVCLLLQHMPEDMRNAPPWQREFFPITVKYHDYCKGSRFEHALTMHPILSKCAIETLRLAAEHVAMGFFIDEKLSLKKEERNYAGISEVLTLQRDRHFPPIEDRRVMPPHASVLDMLELLVEQRPTDTARDHDASDSALAPRRSLTLSEMREYPALRPSMHPFLHRHPGTNPRASQQILADASEKRISDVLAAVDNNFAGRRSSDAGTFPDSLVHPIPRLHG